ncbi:MAG: DNA starvation/stationary phase protection protein [Microbacteriaceae bacterium]
MTDTTIKKSVQDADVANGVSQFLSPVVIHLSALAVDGKQAHWNVRGMNFIAVHELLDTIVDNARAATDVAAERIVALGLPVDARIQVVAKETKTPKLTSGFLQSEKMIAEVIAQIDATLKVVHTAITELEDIDPTSQDIAIEIARTLEQDRWFLFAHISK